MVKNAAIPWIYSIPHADVLVSRLLEGIQKAGKGGKKFAMASLISLLFRVNCLRWGQQIVYS